MFNIVEYIKTNKYLRSRLEEVEDVLAFQQERVGDPAAVIEKLLKGDLKWYDYNRLPNAERIAYKQRAKEILRNPVFKNETNKFIADLINEIAKQTKNFDEVLGLRYTINGAQALRERFEEISVEIKPGTTMEDLSNGI